MGCRASSTATGREANSPSVPRGADTFFPPDDTVEFNKSQKQQHAPPQPAAVPLSPTRKNQRPKQVTEQATRPQVDTFAATSPGQVSPSSGSKTKKKTAYVPPPPITASVPNVPPSLFLPSSVTSNTPTEPTKNRTQRATVAGSHIRHPSDEGSVDPFDKVNEEDDHFARSGPGVARHRDYEEEEDEEDFGELIIPNSDCDPTVISAMTTDTSGVGDKKRPVIVTEPSARSMEAPTPNSESGMRFDELYRLKGVLGTGAFSTVREGFHRSNADISYAVKCINRKKLSEEDEAALLDEVSILKEMRHLHIIRLYDFFLEPSTYYLIMERMSGGELFDRIVAKAYYSEKEARDTCRIILDAVGYCHSNRVAHRDLKPENLLLLSEDDDSAVKIADFGFAKRVMEPNSLTTQCGTPGYVAPEILEGTAYDERADMWSVGVILYILLGGYPPFIESTQRDLFRKIRKGDYEFHEEYWGTVSAEAKGLISSLLTVDATKRLTAQQGLENEWITGDDAKLANRGLDANLKKLQNFNAKRKFRAAVSTVMAANKLNSLTGAFTQKPFKTESYQSDDEGVE